MLAAISKKLLIAAKRLRLVGGQTFRMTKTIFISTILSLLIYSCATKTILKNGDLKGYCGYEIVKADSCLIKFNTDNTFIRTGTMYIQTSGTYLIKSDTLIVNYYCDSCSDSKAICCGKQSFIKTDKGKLKMVSFFTIKGEVMQLPKDYQDIELFKCAD
ncbi:MAG: hypothetical protein Q8L81_07635 [Bacteroidota bacterium]|nr:hypothetical protein [Bacteroidota bacterium]